MKGNKWVVMNNAKINETIKRCGLADPKKRLGRRTKEWKYSSR